MKYRLASRNLVWGGSSLPKPISTTSAVGGRDHLNEATLLRLQRLIVSLYQPSVLETLSRLTIADLDPWARTCPWMRFCRTRPALIRHPRSLQPHLPFDDIPRDHLLGQSQPWVLAAQRAEEEIRELSIGKRKRVFGTKLGGIAALSLLENTRWGKQQREDIFEESLDDPESCYFFASSVTPTDLEWKRLIAELVISPRFLFFAMRLAHFPSDPDLRSAMNDAIAEDPILHFALDEPQGRVSKKKLEAFLFGEIQQPNQCLLGLVVDPDHERAGEWVDVIAQHPALSYEAGCLLRYSGQIPAEEKFRLQLKMAAFKDPKWGAHWIRDLGHEPDEETKDLVPHLEWIAELIETGACSLEIAHEIDEAAGSTMDDMHWLRSSFVLYCGDKKNET